MIQLGPAVVLALGLLSMLTTIRKVFWHQTLGELRNTSYHLLLGDLTDHSIVCYVECELEKEYIAWLDTTDHSKEWFHFNLGAPIKSAKFASTIKGYEIKKGCLFQVKWIQQNGETWGLLSRIDRSIIP